MSVTANPTPVDAAYCRLCRLVMPPGGLAQHSTAECIDRIAAHRASPKKPPGGLHLSGPHRPRPTGFGLHPIQRAKNKAAREASAAA